MAQFEGNETVPTTLAAVETRLSDAKWLAESLPDARVLEATADRAVWRVRPKLAFVAGELETVGEVSTRESQMVQYRLVSKGVGSGSVMNATLRFHPEGTSTRIHWTADLVEMTGLLKMVPPALMQAAAKKVIAEVWTALRDRFAQDETSPA